MLNGLIDSGLTIGGTWPMRSELSNRMVASGTNALASSIVLVCRPRPADAPSISRREFTAILRQELPLALAKLTQGGVAPVDLAQASIGPGMAVFTRYRQVLEPDGSPLPVRTALGLINQVLDEHLAAQEGHMDQETRFCVTWFEEHHFGPGLYGTAETLCKAKNTSVDGLVTSGVVQGPGGEGAAPDPVGVPRTLEPGHRQPGDHLGMRLAHGAPARGEGPRRGRGTPPRDRRPGGGHPGPGLPPLRHL